MMKSLSTIKRVIIIALLAGGGYTIGAVLSPANSTAVPTRCEHDICVEYHEHGGNSFCTPSLKSWKNCDAHAGTRGESEWGCSVQAC